MASRDDFASQATIPVRALAFSLCLLLCSVLCSLGGGGLRERCFGIYKASPGELEAAGVGSWPSDDEVLVQAPAAGLRVLWFGLCLLLLWRLYSFLTVI